jgi:hypothetical protein
MARVSVRVRIMVRVRVRSRVNHVGIRIESRGVKGVGIGS